jgi:predicted short-subunit dehydrogenase-like oxidoreductase (DUF2520 family)
MNIFLIGTGRMAYHLGHAMHKAGHVIVGITGRDPQKLADMSRFLECPLVRWNQDWPEAEITVIATSDDAIAEMSGRLKPSIGVVMHTAGAVDMDVLAPHEHRGVLWPVQTLSHGAPTDLSDIPLMVDGNTVQARETVLKLARSISESVLQLTHAQRQRLHLAAAITSNLPVFLVSEAQRLLRQENLPPDLLMPLWRTTAANVSAIGPEHALTGPARRGDTRSIRKHLDQLTSDPDLRRAYAQLSAMILKAYSHPTDGIEDVQGDPR